MNIGLAEILVIAAVALVLLGPEKFPEFAKIVIRTVRDIRTYVNEAKRDLAQEFKPVKKEFRELSRYEPEKYLESLSKSVVDAVEGEPSEQGDAGSERSQPVAGAPPAADEPGEADGAPGEAEDASQPAPGAQAYGGSNYSAAQQGEKYQGPERIDG
jgi:sec-independent protein translocase protein TatB